MELRNNIDGIRLTHDVAALREVKGLLEREIESLENRLVISTRNCQEYEKQESGYRTSVSAAKRAVDAVKSELEALSVKPDALKYEISELLKNKELAAASYAGAKAEMDSHHSRMQKAREDLAQADKEMKEARRDKVASEADRRRILKECDDKIALAQKKEQDANEAVEKLNSLMSILKK